MHSWRTCCALLALLLMMAAPLPLRAQETDSATTAADAPGDAAASATADATEDEWPTVAQALEQLEPTLRDIELMRRSGKVDPNRLAELVKSGDAILLRAREPEEYFVKVERMLARTGLRQAAAQVLPDDHPKRQQYLDQTYAITRPIRENWGDHPLAGFLTVAEARSQRIEGNTHVTTTLLTPLLQEIQAWAAKADRREDQQHALWRTQVAALAVMELIATDLPDRPHRAVTRADELAWASDLAMHFDQPRISLENMALAHHQPQDTFWGNMWWNDALRKLRLRGQTLALLRDAKERPQKDHPQRAQQLARTLRQDTGILPDYDRLEMLVELDEPFPILDDHELRDWAQQLAMCGRSDEIIPLWQRRLTRSDTSQTYWNYAWAMQQNGRLDLALDAISTLQKRTTTDASQQLRLLQMRAAFLWQLLNQLPPDHPDVQKRRHATEGALWQLAKSEAAEEVRADALKGWLELALIEQSPSELWPELAPWKTLYERDGVLAYHAARCYAQWISYQQQLVDADAKAIGEHMRKLAAMWENACKLAQQDQQPERAAHCALQQVATLGSAALAQHKSALAALDAHWELLAGSPQAEKAARVYVGLALAAGAPEKAAAAMDRKMVAQHTPQRDLLALIQALMQGDNKTIDASQIDTAARKRIADMARLVLSGPALQQSHALLLGRWLTMIDEMTLADQCLANVPADALAQRGDAAMLVARGKWLVREHREDEARALFTAATRAGHDSAQMLAALGHTLALGGKHEAAIEAFRKARNKEKAGTDAWWAMTLEVCRMQLVLQQVDEARKIMQVSLALYPPPSDSALAGDVQVMQLRLAETQKDVP